MINFRLAKVEIINENPLVELYEDFLSLQELDILTRDISRYSFQTAQTLDKYGDQNDVDFRVEVMIDDMDSIVVKDLHSKIEEVAILSTNQEDDYVQVGHDRITDTFFEFSCLSSTPLLIKTLSLMRS